MSDIKVSEMPEATELNNNDLLMVVQNGVNKKVEAEKMGIVGDTVPIGAIMEWFSETIPENWLLCNGQSVNIADYPELFDVIGTTYGAGSTTTTFKVPNYEGRSPIGVNESDTDFEILGAKGGEKQHELTISEIPYKMDSQRNSDTGTNWNNQGITQRTPNPISLMQPYITTYFIIKAKQSAGLVATVVDNLESESRTNALSAKQGKVLNEKIEGTVLYENENGSDGSTPITLSDSVSNFDEIEIEYYVSDTYTSNTKFFKSTGRISTSCTYIELNMMETSISGNMELIAQTMKLENNSLSLQGHFNFIVNSNGGIQTVAQNTLKISKVKGYN